MSKLSPSPNYCSCTVNQARNLPDKGKNGGIDPFCTIAMGKEKFVTAVREKTTSPDWHEQCDMAIVDDATIKLTVYHNNKSSLSKGEFIGRAYVSLRDLQDYDRVHTKWYKLTNKEGKTDKDRGEIEVSLQFYSKNNTTGSVLDLATKKKHLSLKDIKHSLSDKLKSAAKPRKHERQGGENQLSDQRRRLGGDDGSSQNVRDFLDDSPSESTSFTGSHMSLNSMQYNNNAEQQKKKSRAPTNGTPYSSRRSITSDYETSSILDSASMYGGEETSTPSSTVHPPIQQPPQEINVDEHLSSKNISNKKKTQEPLPTIITTKWADSPTSADRSRSFSITTDSNKSKELESTSKADTLFGLSTIKENLDTNENVFNSKQQQDEEIDFDNYWNQIKNPPEPKKSKKPAPILQQPKEKKRSTLSQSDDIQTPSTSISVKINPISTSSTTTKQSDNTHDDSTDEDVDELLGKLERMSSMRSSVKRKIQPRDDIMQQSFSETENKPPSGLIQTPNNRNRKTTLPDIVGEQTVTNSTQRPKKPVTNGLSVLGYDNVKSTPINPKIRQELDYLDREELLHVIAHQSDIIKKRDTRLKDLEHYTDGLLCKIVEQCPTILQVGGSTKR